MAIYTPPELTANEEPLLHELLEDPITNLLMQTDGVKRTTLDPLIEEISNKMSAPEAA